MGVSVTAKIVDRSCSSHSNFKHLLTPFYSYFRGTDLSISSSSPDSCIFFKISQPPTNSPFIYSWGNVGQLLNVFIACRSSWSSNMFFAANGTPCTCNMRVAIALKPHCGASGTPFMYNRTGFSFTSFSICSFTDKMSSGALCTGLKSLWVSSSPSLVDSFFGYFCWRANQAPELFDEDRLRRAARALEEDCMLQCDDSNEERSERRRSCVNHMHWALYEHEAEFDARAQWRRVPFLLAAFHARAQWRQYRSRVRLAFVFLPRAGSREAPRK